LGTQKRHPFFEKVKNFFHRLTTKISLVFKGKNAVFTIEIDLTQPIYPQIQGIQETLSACLPDTKDVQEYLKTNKLV
jgi:hypothetical protein